MSTQGQDQPEDRLPSSAHSNSFIHMEALYRRWGWLTAASFLLLALSNGNPWYRVAWGLMGTFCFSHWLAERLEERWHVKLMRWRIAEVLVTFAATISAIVGMIWSMF